MWSQTSSATLFSSGKSDYQIVAQNSESVNEKKAVEIIQKYLQKVSGIDFSQNLNSKFKITVKNLGNDLPEDAFRIRNEGQNIFIEGNKQGLIYGAYTFVEKVLGCRKYNPGEEAFCPSLEELNISLPLKLRKNHSLSSVKCIHWQKPMRNT